MPDALIAVIVVLPLVGVWVFAFFGHRYYIAVVAAETEKHARCGPQH